MITESPCTVDNTANKAIANEIYLIFNRYNTQVLLDARDAHSNMTPAVKASIF